MRDEEAKRTVLDESGKQRQSKLWTYLFPIVVSIF